MHHPMDWFTYEERVLLEEYIADETKFNVDIILNGHIHNGQVSLKSDLDTNIITLVSGVGYSRIKEKLQYTQIRIVMPFIVSNQMRTN